MLVVTGEFNFFASIVFSAASSVLEKAATGARSFLLDKTASPKHFIKQSERGAARFLDRLIAAGQPERAQMSDALDVLVRDEKKFAAPDGAVQAVARAIPGNAKHRRWQFVFRHAGQNVGDVVLDAK